MLGYSNSKLPAGTVIEGSVLTLPFPDNYFDFVYALEVFRYLEYEDNLQGLKEIRRVLKPGGVFFGTFVNKYALDGFYIITGFRKFTKRFFGKSMKCHTEFETPISLERMLKRSGYIQVRINGAMFASLRIAHKIFRPLGEFSARLLEPVDNVLSDAIVFRPFSGHLIGIAKKRMS